MIIELFLAVTLIQVPPNAGPNDSIVWDHDGVNTDHYEARFDNGPWSSTTTDGMMNKFVKIPSLIVGLHTVDARACQGTNCSDPATLQFNMIAIPIPVSNLRIGNVPTSGTTRLPKPTPLNKGIKK